MDEDGPWRVSMDGGLLLLTHPPHINKKACYTLPAKNKPNMSDGGPPPDRAAGEPALPLPAAGLILTAHGGRLGRISEG